MKEIAIFDLDGTLVDLRIDRDDFEKCRSFWASYLTSHGVPTTLKPLLPELHRISQTPLGSSMKVNILKSFDKLELECRYYCQEKLNAILDIFKSKFRKLVLVTHNGLAIWERLAQENTWPHLFDVVITRDDMTFFKPDPRACECVFKELAVIPHGSECWVIGNSEADRELGINLRRKFSNLVVRTIMIDSTCTMGTRSTYRLDVNIESVASLPDLMQEASA